MGKIIIFFSLFFSLSFYGQKDTITVEKTSTISVVSADKMNVVYRGLPNPISISVPNCKSFEATGNGLFKLSDGKFTLQPGPGIETTITVEIVLNDGSIKKEEHKFIIKDLSKIYGAINGLSCDQCIIEMTKQELKTAVISLDLKMYYDGLDIKREKVTSFKIEFLDNNHLIIFDNKLNDKALSIINELKTGSIFKISEIHYPNPLDICRTSPVAIKVMIIK
jgi:hypothetical protein